MKKLLYLCFLLLPFVSSAALPPITGTFSVCSGATTTLSNATPGGTWSSDNTSVATIGSATGVVAGVTAGTADITYTDGMEVAYVTVTVNTSPTAIADSVLHCAGTHVSYGGILPAGGVYSSTNPSVATVSATGLVTAMSVGTARISYTLSTGCFTKATVTVEPNPVFLSAPPVLCADGQRYLDVWPLAEPHPPLPPNYLATSSAVIAVATDYQGDVRVSGKSVGTVTITYTPYTGCSTTIAATVLPAVAPIEGFTPTCTLPITMNFTNATPGGIWHSNNTVLATIGATSGIAFINDVIGNTRISYTVSPGCEKAINLTNDSIMIYGDTSVCVGSTSYLYPTKLYGGAATGGTWVSGTPSVATVISGGYSWANIGLVYGVGVGTAILSYVEPTCGEVFVHQVTVTSTCSGTPIPGIATASDTVVCSGMDVVLDLPSYVHDCGHVIQWQYSSDGASWSDLEGANTVPYTHNPIAPYYYRCRISCGSGGLAALSTVKHVSVNISIGSHSIVSIPDSACASTHFYFAACGVSPLFSVVTFFGDGTNVSTPLSTSVVGDAHIYHNYSTTGSYTVMHVLHNSGIPMDTVIFNYDHLQCNALPIKFYRDNNSSCVFDSGDVYNLTSMLTEVDSNSIPVDTISATSGFYYRASGPAGTVYSFRPLSDIGSMLISCPSAGVIYDTISAGIHTYTPKYFGMTCGPSSTFDLKVRSFGGATGTMQLIYMVVANTNCTAVSPTVTLTFSPKYGYFAGLAPCSYTTPAPASVSGTTMTWGLGSMAPGDNRIIYAYLMRPSSMGDALLPSATATSTISVTPETGDADVTDNVIMRVDTIRTSYDPNDISVTPSGNILNGTELQYTVRFENMGNDTAHNIHIMDTLSGNVDISSLRIVAASAVMNCFIYRAGGHTIVKFDFPNIMLPDSSHHGLCDGMVIYTVKARTGLAHGTLIPNRAGIYFDDNPVVMTNEVNNRILIPSISVTPTSPITVCNTDTVTFTATAISMKEPVYQWVRNGVHVGTNSPTYKAYGLAAGTVISCRLYNPTHDTLIATSNVVVVSIDGMPVAGSVSGVPAVCVGSLAMLVTSVPGGVWSIANGNGTIVSGLVTGVSAGTTTVSYAVSNACGTATAVHHMTVNPLPVAGSISGAAVLCAASTATLIATVPGGAWSTSNSRATVAGGVVTGVSAGSTIISYAVTNSCGTATTTHSMNINPLPVAGSITGVTAVCVGSVVTLTATASGGAWGTSNSNATIAGGIVTGVLAGSTIVSYAVTNSCGTATATHSMTVNPLPVAGSVTGASVVCEAATAMLTATEPGGVWSTTTGSATVTGGTVTGVAAGNTTVSYIVTNSCGTAIATHDMTVNPLPVAGSVAGVPVVCEGSTIVLLATVPGGVWSTSTSGATVASGVVTGVSAGNAAVSYSVSNSCGTVVATHSVTVNPLPVAGSITGVSEVCVGQQISLLASAAGGVWSISNSNAIVTSGSVTGVVDGSTTVSYAVSNSCGTAVATHSMMVKPQPAAGSITGAQEVCEGAGVGLSATEPGGVWSTSNNNAVATGVMITGVSAGSTIVSYAVSNSCGTAVATYGMTVKPRPVAGTLSGPDVVCKDASVTIAASAPGGEWLVSNDKVAVAAGVVTGISEGVAVVYYKVSNDCGTATATHTVTVEPLPAAGMISGEEEVYEGAVIPMTASVAGGTWEVSAGATVKDGKVTGVSAGQCTITYTVANSCGSNVVYKVINVLKPGEPILLPNPATNVVTVKANGVAYNSFVITNNAGQVILQAAFTNPQTSIDLSRLPAGVYYIKLVGAGNTVVKKFTKI